MAKKRKTMEEDLDHELSRLRMMMRDGEVKFKYEKKDGSIRTARGTTKNDLIPDDHRSESKKRKSTDTILAYFDLDKEEWRCFRKENFLGIVE